MSRSDVKRLMMIRHCPADLLESIASVGYCSTRVEANELREITQLLAAKYGGEWMRDLAHNKELVPTKVSCRSKCIS